jgi:hypothetical protein
MHAQDKDEIDRCGDDLIGRLRVIADHVDAVAKEMEPVARGGDLDYQPNIDEIRDWMGRLQYLCGRLHGTAIRLDTARASKPQDGKL